MDWWWLRQVEGGCGKMFGSIYQYDVFYRSSQRWSLSISILLLSLLLLLCDLTYLVSMMIKIVGWLLVLYFWLFHFFLNSHWHLDTLPFLLIILGVREHLIPWWLWGIFWFGWKLFYNAGDWLVSIGIHLFLLRWWLEWNLFLLSGGSINHVLLVRTWL